MLSILLGTGAFGAGQACAASDGPAALLVEKSIAAAQRRGDIHALAALLDDGFTMIEPTGRVRGKAETMAHVAGTAPYAGDVPDTRVYGGLAAITGNHYLPSAHANTRFLHIFVKRSGRWRAFAFVETTILSASSAPPTSRVLPASIPPGDAVGSCDNPCRTIPFSPKNAAERAVMEAYQQLEQDSVTADVVAFAGRLADELQIVLANYTGTPLTKEEAIASHQKLKDRNLYYPPVPITDANVAVFGTGAVMIARHYLPSDPAKSSMLTQVWIWRDRRWQMALSQQVRIEPVAAGDRSGAR